MKINFSPTLCVLLIILALALTAAVVILGGYNVIVFYGILILPLALILLYFYRKHKKSEVIKKVDESTDWKARFAKASIFPKAITVFFLLILVFFGSRCLGFGGELAGLGCIGALFFLYLGAPFILLLWLIAACYCVLDKETASSGVYNNCFYCYNYFFLCACPKSIADNSLLRQGYFQTDTASWKNAILKINLW